MFKRLVQFGIAFALLAVPLEYMVIKSKDQTPWLVAVGAYFIVGSLIGNGYVPFGARYNTTIVWRWLLLNAFAWFAIALAYVAIVTRNFHDPLWSQL